MADFNPRALTRQITGPVDPARVQKQLDDLAKVIEVTQRVLTEKDLDRLLAIIVADVTDVLDCERSSLFLVDAERQELYSKVAEQSEITEIRFPMRTGLAGACARDNAAINIPDAYADRRFNRDIDRQTGYRTRSILCFPLSTAEGKVVGVIQSLNKRGGPFTDYDLALLGAFSQQAAIALDNARLAQAYLDREKLRRAMEIAQEIQISLLPREAPEIPGLSIAGTSTPCDETGGDYYDYLTLGGDFLGLAIGDVSGHGLGAALFMAMARSLLRSLAVSLGDPARVLAAMNAPLEADMADERFMTLLYAVLNTRTWTLAYASGGHDEPLIWRANEQTWDELQSTGLPIGLLPDQEFPLGRRVRFAPGDLLLLATDGIWEAMNLAGEAFGRERLKDTVAARHTQSADEIVAAVREAVERFVEPATMHDDFTLVVVRFDRPPDDASVKAPAAEPSAEPPPPAEPPLPPAPAPTRADRFIALPETPPPETA